MSKPSAERMQILISGGSGLIGQHLVQHWHDRADITILGRSLPHLQRMSPKLQHLDWQTVTPEHMARMDVVINLCGANIGTRPWTSARRALLLSSRVEPTRRLVELCQKADRTPKCLIQASGTSVYGCYADRHRVFIERDPPPRTDHHLPQLAQAWEQATAGLPTSMQLAIMRLGVVLSPNGGALPQMRLPHRFGLGGVMGTGEQGFPWIAMEDVGGAIDHVLQHGLRGPVNLLAPALTSHRDLAQALSGDRPPRWHWPAWLFRPMGALFEELLLLGQYAQPQMLLDSGYVFRHPSLSHWLQLHR